jgi:ribosomal protein S18 acetylase RimI-like enzyme
MTVNIRTMQPAEAEDVAAMVHGLARDLKLDVTPRLTGERLRAAHGLVYVAVAEQVGRLVGACLSLMTFSTFRGARGLYVVDLFVDGAMRGQNIGVKLLRFAARHGASQGAEFIKLEVDVSNVAGARFYDGLKFSRKPDDRLFVLEPQDFQNFIAEERMP